MSDSCLSSKLSVIMVACTRVLYHNLNLLLPPSHPPSFLRMVNQAISKITEIKQELGEKKCTVNTAISIPSLSSSSSTLFHSSFSLPLAPPPPSSPFHHSSLPHNYSLHLFPLLFLLQTATARPTTQQRKMEDFTAPRYDTLSCHPCLSPLLFLLICQWDVPFRRTGMRKGMLMTVLQQYALKQPVWRGKPGEE